MCPGLRMNVQRAVAGYRLAGCREKTGSGRSPPLPPPPGHHPPPYTDTTRVPPAWGPGVANEPSQPTHRACTRSRSRTSTSARLLLRAFSLLLTRDALLVTRPRRARLGRSLSLSLSLSVSLRPFVRWRTRPVSMISDTATPPSVPYAWGHTTANVGPAVSLGEASRHSCPRSRRELAPCDDRGRRCLPPYAWGTPQRTWRPTIARDLDPQPETRDLCKNTQEAVSPSRSSSSFGSPGCAISARTCSRPACRVSPPRQLLACVAHPLRLVCRPERRGGGVGTPADHAGWAPAHQP
jgi:hypothetical protein